MKRLEKLLKKLLKKNNYENNLCQLEIEELLSKFLYKIERNDKTSLKSDFTKWN